MCFHDARDVLGVLPLAHGSRGGTSTVGRETRALRARVHVRLIVVADVNEVLVALGGAGQRLDADVTRAAVACHGEHSHLVSLTGRAQARSEP